MPTRDKHIINVHTGTGTTEPSGADLRLGEIAVQHTPDNPALWIKVGTGETSDVYEKFIGETEIVELIDNSEIILGSGYTYSGLPYVNSATTIADAYSALTREMIDNEKVVSEAINDLNGRINTLSGESADYALEADLVSLSASVISNKGAVTAVTVTGTGSVVTDAVYTNSALTLTKGNPEVTLGPDYTYSGLPYVNSATVLADAYSALTSEVVAGLSAVVESNEYVAAMALNDLDRRITEISGNTGGDVDPLSAAVISLSAAVITISGNTGGGGDIQPLSSATHTHINNNDIHVTAADKTAWTNGANSGASAWTAVTELSAATTAHTGNALIHVPTGGTDGQYLSLVNGTPTWSTPVTVYSGENPPARSLGNNGDIYIQTS